MDDGSEGKFGKEINFRTNLEDELRKGKSLGFYRKLFKKNKSSSSSDVSRSNHNDNLSPQNDETILNESVPMVLIVVQGGPNTLTTVDESIKKKIPVLILAVILYYLI